MPLLKKKQLPGSRQASRLKIPVWLFCITQAGWLHTLSTRLGDGFAATRQAIVSTGCALTQPAWARRATPYFLPFPQTSPRDSTRNPEICWNAVYDNVVVVAFFPVMFAWSQMSTCRAIVSCPFSFRIEDRHRLLTHCYTHSAAKVSRGGGMVCSR